jgi:acetylornithine deacetylase/succinyl-diaminopimelate desuccinylase-like protein
LIAALERLRTYQSPARLTPPVERYFESAAPYERPPLRERLANIGQSLRDPAFVVELEKVPRYAALLHNTISITVLNGSKKVNVIPPVASADVDCRLLPGVTMADWIQEVKSVIRDDSITIEPILNFSHTESQADTPLAQVIRRVVKRNCPEAGFVFPVQAGFTDSHFFREMGIVSYGFVPFALTEEDLDRAHGNDERIPVKTFADGVRLMWEVVYEFSKMD